MALNIEGSYLTGQLLYFSVSDHGWSDSLFVGIALSAADLCKSVYRWCREVFYI